MVNIDGAPITGKAEIIAPNSSYAIGYNLSMDDTGRSFKGRSVTVEIGRASCRERV